MRGYDGAKRLNGRKRHLLVDTGGLILHAVVHSANCSDRTGARQVLEGIPQRCPTVRQIWTDAGYTGELITWAHRQLGITLTVIKRPRRWVRVPADHAPAPLPVDMPVLPRRWVVERTFAWLGRHRRLSKDYEQLPETEVAWIYVAMMHLMTRRLAK